MDYNKRKKISQIFAWKLKKKEQKLEEEETVIMFCCREENENIG